MKQLSFATLVIIAGPAVAAPPVYCTGQDGDSPMIGNTEVRPVRDRFARMVAKIRLTGVKITVR